jgi:lysophospholipase L1-like esterase
MSLTFKLLSSPLWVTQALWMRRHAQHLPEAEGERSGEVGEGAPLRLLIVGDSSAAGVGVATQRQGFSGHLTRTLAQRAGLRVHWSLVARSGVSSAQALDLVQQAAPPSADLAVVLLGVNDVIEQLPSHQAVAHRAELADWLKTHASVRHVVFTPLPPMGEFPSLRPPLRWVVKADAQRHDRALAQWAATRSDVWHVPIPMSLSADVMAADGFHAGEPVYKICGEAVAEFISARLLLQRQTTPLSVTTKVKA